MKSFRTDKMKHRLLALPHKREECWMIMMSESQTFPGYLILDILEKSK